MIGPGKLITQCIVIIVSAYETPGHQLCLIVIANDVGHGVVKSAVEQRHYTAKMFVDAIGTVDCLQVL
jgi:adenosyl cobinamide kinase/adenosyl cobinamide phosphate guanylyltransferase